MLTPLILALILSVVYFLSETFFKYLKKKSLEIRSFSAGMFITYIFLTMFPELIVSKEFIGNNGLFIAMWGFILLHITEKYIIQHAKNYVAQKKKLIRVRMSGFFINHLMLGFALAFFFIANPVLGYISIIPLGFHMISSALWSEEIHKRYHQKISGKLFASSAIFIGALISLFLKITPVIYFSLFALVTGTFLYIIVRDVMPKEKEGNVFYFLYGVIFYLLAIGIEMLLMRFIF